MQISACMKRSVISISGQAPVKQAAALFTNNHIGTLPVVDEGNQLVGLLRLRDLLSLVMPDFLNLLDHFEFAHDFGVLEARKPKPEELEHPVYTIMKPPVSVEDTSGLLRSMAMLDHHNLPDIPVVDAHNRLVGIASRVDIGIALIRQWKMNGTL